MKPLGGYYDGSQWIRCAGWSTIVNSARTLTRPAVVAVQIESPLSTLINEITGAIKLPEELALDNTSTPVRLFSSSQIEGRAADDDDTAGSCWLPQQTGWCC